MMGIDMFVGDEQFRLTNAYWYNEFLNWVAVVGDFPHILNHSPAHGSYVLDASGPPTMYKGSVNKLREEVEKLLDESPPSWAEDILRSILNACDHAIKHKTKITMDDGSWED